VVVVVVVVHMVHMVRNWLVLLPFNILLLQSPFSFNTLPLQSLPPSSTLLSYLLFHNASFAAALANFLPLYPVLFSAPSATIIATVEAF
jgi:hypothetical protein